MLGLVEDEKAVGDGASADVGEGFHFDNALFDELVVGLAAGLGGGLGFALFALGAFGGGGDHEEVEGIVDGLEPGAHFLFQGAGEEAHLLAHGDDGPANGEAVVVAGKDFAKSGGDGDEGLSGAGLAIAGDERDVGIEEGVDETLLSEVERLEIGAAGDADALGDGEADELIPLIEARGHGLLGTGFEENVLVGGDGIDDVGELRTLPELAKRWRSLGSISIRGRS